ncbi:MAG: hypothetical protein HY314_05675 [Acidobacteria bacterium]|nr:hypothetical protein [Acidobacteriota bacterium]
MPVEPGITQRKDTRVPRLSTLCPDRTVRATFLFLLILGGLLVVCHVVAGVANKIYANEVTAVLRDFFGLEREGSVTTWFSSLQLALMAVVCGVIFVGERASHSATKSSLVWLGFLLLFLFLSLDETAQVHERLDQILHALRTPVGASAEGTTGVTIYSYLMLYVPVLAGVIAVMMRFFSHRVKNRASCFLLAAGLVGFAMKLGLEPIEAWAGDTTWLGHHIMFEIVILQVYALILGETLILIALLNHAVAGNGRSRVIWRT